MNLHRNCTVIFVQDTVGAMAALILRPGQDAFYLLVSGADGSQRLVSQDEIRALATNNPGMEQWASIVGEMDRLNAGKVA